MYQRTPRPAPIRLEERDVAVLEALATHRFLSGDQLRRLLFTCGPSMVRRRLRALYDHRLIDRVALVAQATRGIPPFVYVLGRDGIDVLAELGQAAPGGGVTGAGLRLLRHRFLVNDFYVSLIEATRGTPYTVIDWRHEERLKLATADSLGRAEQVSHRLLPRATPFLPDAFFQLGLSGGESLAFFVEVDLATHSQRVWRERARLYTAYADPQTGLFRRRFGRETFRLLIATTPDYRGRSRRDNILASIREAVGPSDLFLATTLPQVKASTLLGPIWQQADGTCGIEAA